MKTFREIAELHYTSEPTNKVDKQYKQNMIKALEKLLNEQLSQCIVSVSLLSEIRQAVAAHVWSEGCSCCRSDNHDENGERLAVRLVYRKGIWTTYYPVKERSPMKPHPNSSP
jgi:hypothetical protein